MPEITPSQKKKILAGRKTVKEYRRC